MSSGEDTNQSYTDIDFAFTLGANGRLKIYEDKILKRDFYNNSYAQGDILSVEVIGDDVVYRKKPNGGTEEIVHVTYDVEMGSEFFPLHVDTSFHSEGATLKEVKIIAEGDPLPQLTTPSKWNEQYGVLPIDGTDDLMKVGADTGAGSWDSSAILTQTITADNKGVETVVGEINEVRAFGLRSSENENRSYADIDFAFVLSANGRLSIQELGNLVIDFFNNSYAAGDKLSIEIIGNLVYIGEGTEILEHHVITAFPSAGSPFYVDTSFRTPGATLKNITIIDAGPPPQP